MAAAFHRAAIIGTGLIGGSFALALRKHFPEVAVVGWDKPQVLQQALERNAISEGITDLPVALAKADLVYIALPVGHTIELLPEIGRLAPRTALVTDACSTKRSVCAAAAESFKDDEALFLGGHPMAGKEISGIASADANLFRGSKYALIAAPAKGVDSPKKD
jgi:prephenate dehydrogenase